MLVASKLRSICSRLAPLKSPIQPPSRLASDEFSDNPFELEEVIEETPVVPETATGINSTDLKKFQERVNEALFDR